MVLLSALFCGETRAQTPAPDPIKLGKVTLSGSVRVRWEGWDWFDTSAADGSYDYWGSIVRLGLSQNFTNWDWQVESAAPFLLNLPVNAIAPAPQGQLGFGATYYASNRGQVGSVFLKQAVVRLKNLAGDKASSLRLGRMEFIEGLETTPKDGTLATLKRLHIAQRLIGNFGFSHVGRSFDGGQFVRDTTSSNVTLLAGRATQGSFQLDGMKELDVDLIYGALTKPLHNTVGKGKVVPGEARLFVLHYHDGRRTLKTDNRPAAQRAADSENIRVTTFGGHYLGVLDSAAGKTDLLVWGALQTGSWGLQDHHAGALAVEIGFQPELGFLKPWFRAGYFRGSGDDDPVDGQHKTFFQVLPTPRLYARFPFFNLMNTQDVFTQLTLRPHSRLSVQADIRTLRLSSAQDLWYAGGGAYQQDLFGFAGRPSRGSRSLATLFDISADYRASARTTLTFYFGQALGRGIPDSIYPDGRNATFGYVELTQRF